MSDAMSKLGRRSREDRGVQDNLDNDHDNANDTYGDNSANPFGNGLV
jgi:hypothetical protein